MTLSDPRPRRCRATGSSPRTTPSLTGRRVRLAKKHLQPLPAARRHRRTRPRRLRPDRCRGVDVDPATGRATADVQGMCTYEHLVAETLARDYIPYVVPQLRTITLGGAVTGLGIESTSFRNGLPHESVVEMDILTGAGEAVTCSREEHSRPVRGLPELVRHPRLHDPHPDPAREGAAERAPAARPLRRPCLSCGQGDRPHRGDRQSRRRTGGRASTARRSRRGGSSSRWRSSPTPIRPPPVRASATTPGSTSTTARSRSGRPTRSRWRTTSGGGTPTGSGAAARSAHRTR